MLNANQKNFYRTEQELAELETMEHGSPIRKTMNFDVPLCAEQLEYFAGVARAMTGETLPVGLWCLSTTVREPLGIVGLITPWNFPALMVVWKLGGGPGHRQHLHCQAAVHWSPEHAQAGRNTHRGGGTGWYGQCGSRSG